MKTLFTLTLLILLSFNARAGQIEYDSEQLKQRIDKQEQINTPRQEPEKSATEQVQPPQSEAPAPAPDEDAFGNITHSSVPQFLNSRAKRDENNPDGPFSFELETAFRNPDDDERKLISIASLTVFATADNGLSWASAPMRLTSEKNKLQQTWQAQMPSSSFNGAATVTYYFTAIDSFGNVTTELPLTTPGWPPVPESFFAAAQDENNSDDLVDPSMDVLKSWIARDNDNIYVATQLDAPFSMGTVAPAFIHIYVNKFTDPAKEQNEGLMVGKYIYTAPLTFTSPEIIDITAILGGRSTNFCASPRTPADPSGAFAGKLLFTKTPIKTICAEPCQSLSLVSFTSVNASLDAYAPIPLDSSPYTFIYLRSHTLPESQSTSPAGSPCAASPVTIDQLPSTKTTPKEISQKNNDKRCPFSTLGTPFLMNDEDAFDFGIGKTIESIANTAIIGGILYILAK